VATRHRRAGIYNNGANSGSLTLTVSTTVLHGNSADSSGGSIRSHVFEGSGTLALIDSIFSGNSACSSTLSRPFALPGVLLAPKVCSTPVKGSFGCLDSRPVFQKGIQKFLAGLDA
jgi:hypothetical protein